MSLPAPITPSDFTNEDALNFWNRIVKTSDGCWILKSVRSRKRLKGPTPFHIGPVGKKRTVNAARFAYYLQKGIDPYPDMVLHSCRNGACMNGKHLYPGSRKDAFRKPQFTRRFSEKDIEKIKQLWWSRKKTQAQLAAEYGCSQATISAIVRKKAA